MSQDSKRNPPTGTTVSLRIPAQNPGLFGTVAIDDLLVLLSRNRGAAFTIRELADRTEHSKSTVSRAVDVLVDNGLVVETRDGNRRLVEINRERLSVPDDPFLRIPQQEFARPVEAAVDALTEELEDVLAIVLFGSVARGEADRRSDVDLWVLVEENRPENQRRANRIKTELEERRFDGDRYGYDVDVEALASVPAYRSEIRTIVESGIVVHQTPSFETVRRLIEHGEDGDE